VRAWRFFKGSDFAFNDGRVLETPFSMLLLRGAAAAVKSFSILEIIASSLMRR
jgi:hypothetical protein